MILQAFREADGERLETLAAPPGFLAELQREWPSLSTRARMIAIDWTARKRPAGADRFLLERAKSEPLQIAVAAARRAAGPAKELLDAIPACRPEVRGRLVRAVRDPKALGVLRDLAAAESDSAVKREAQFAAARLGGRSEWDLVFRRIREAGPEEAEEARSWILDARDPLLVHALLPWFGDERNVRCERPHFDAEWIRMCDLAVWTIHEFGLAVRPAPATLTRMSADQRSSAARAVHLATAEED